MANRSTIRPNGWPLTKRAPACNKSSNQSLSAALRHDNHLLELKAGVQNIPFQGVPNQRMDMTSNKSEQVNLRYKGQ
jgi:iron complex outermembrane receptor protein